MATLIGLNREEIRTALAHFGLTDDDIKIDIEHAMLEGLCKTNQFYLIYEHESNSFVLQTR